MLFKIPTATLITLSGLVAAGLLLIALTGENVSSSMDALPTVSIPGMPTTIPSIPGAPTIPSMARPTATPTPTPTPIQATPPARSSPPESIPGLVRVTEVPSPTPEPTPGITADDIAESQTYLPTTTITPVVAPTTVERSSPSTWLIIGLIAVVGAIFVVFGVYSVFRRRK